MKTSRRLFKNLSLLGLLCISVPVLLYALWIYSANLGGDQENSVSIYKSFLPDFLQGRFDTSWLSIFFCIAAIIFSYKGLELNEIVWKLLNRLVLIVGIILLFLNLFSMM